MVDKQLAIKYMAQGISTDQIAAALGCDPSYISQLRADPEIARQVTEQTSSVTIKDAAFDERLNTAEEVLLGRIEKTAFAR